LWDFPVGEEADRPRRTWPETKASLDMEHPQIHHGDEGSCWPGLTGQVRSPDIPDSRWTLDFRDGRRGADSTQVVSTDDQVSGQPSSGRLSSMSPSEIQVSHGGILASCRWREGKAPGGGRQGL